MYTFKGIKYKEPEVLILNSTPLLVAELAGRTAYDSFKFSEHKTVRDFHLEKDIENLDADSSEILHKLSWVHHHLSVLELVDISFLLTGVSRGVLQELARHRIASLTVRSTRYTMQDILHAFNVARLTDIVNKEMPISVFITLIKDMNMFVLLDDELLDIEIKCIYEKLNFYLNKVGEIEFLNHSMSKDALDTYKGIKSFAVIENYITNYKAMVESKSKRNVGDPFKFIVTDNWLTDLVIKFNLRSLKNFFDLRDHGAAWFQMKKLAQGMKASMEIKHLRLIDKEHRDK